MKIKQATKSRTNRPASNALLCPSKRRKRRVCTDPTPSDTPSRSDTHLAAPFDDDSTEEEQEADCVYRTGRLSEDHKGEEWMQCAKYFRRAYTFCAGMEENFDCGPYQGQTLFRSLYLLYLNFFKFCNYSLCFLCKFLTSPN